MKGTDDTPLDLDPESRRALEWDGLLEAVARRAVTAQGAVAMRGLTPLRGREAIEDEHASVAEVTRHLAGVGRLLGGGLPDPAATLAGLAVMGLRIEAAALRDLSSVLVAAADLRQVLAGLSRQEFPRMRTIAGSTPDLRAEAQAVLRNVGPDGRIADDASPELRRIRTSIGRVADRLRRMLESLVREPGAHGVIQDEFVTQRNGRFVIPVRVDAPRPVRGIVHGASSSGATLFVEPLDSVDLNNELVRLAEQEIEEQDRVLRQWADRFRARLAEVLAAQGGLIRVDGLQARALYASDLGAVFPAIDPGGGLRLVELRHPLLERRLREAGARSVPLALMLRPEDRVLVLSGPNAGGKTVALKALGLAVLSAQAGIPVVAGEASLPLFRQVRADIGDHQSIDADLSTFSAHMQAVGRFLREADAPCLFLFDEIGTGTEPSEGAALARAVLERLIRPGITTVATTHLGSLKTWALTTDGVASAAMEFDTEALRPTYRVLPGVAGVSAGLDIARRMGLHEEVLARAKEHLGPEAGRSEAYLDRLRTLTTQAEALRDALAREEEALAEERRRLEARAAGEVAERRAEAQRALEEALREFREQGRREIESIRDRKERARLEREQAKAEIRLHGEAARRQTSLATPTAERRHTRPAAPLELAPGVPVHVRSLERDGEVVEVRGSKVIVRMGAAAFAVNREDLVGVNDPVVPAPPPPPAGGKLQHLVARHAAEPGPALSDDAASPVELILLGKTVDEALEEVDRFLDRSAVAGRPEVRIVHGHGTGRLRAAIRRFLQGHPHVAGKRPGAPSEGGDGATVVTLR